METINNVKEAKEKLLEIQRQFIHFECVGKGIADYVKVVNNNPMGVRITDDSIPDYILNEVKKHFIII
jgi:hypothetical protein